MRVPLIRPVYVVVHRLAVQQTWAVNPPGSAFSEGYDDVLQEPVVNVVSGVRSVPRAELAEVRVPGQVEVVALERLRMTFGGDAPVTRTAFIFHRKHLKTLGLINATTGRCLLKKGDRISRVELRNGTVARTFQDAPYTTPTTGSLYIYELQARSWGFGPDRYDLEVAFTTHRSTFVGG